MPTDVFDPVLFIEEGDSRPLRDSAEFPFLANRGGKGTQLSRQAGDLIPIAPVNPDLDLGTKYTEIKHAPKKIEDEHPYWITLFDFGKTETVHYEALRATKETAQAFGMTLLKDGECVRFPFHGLITAQYTYGKWAAHQSPYLGRNRRRELLAINATDLEYHNFAHVFFSQDPDPLVISVARWRPYVNEIALADLWVSPGDALVLPPKQMPCEPPDGTPYEQKRRIVLDLHGNRNSALACWFNDRKAGLRTTTILANEAVMSAEETKPHYCAEFKATQHRPLPQAE